MAAQKREGSSKRPGPKDIWRLILMVIGVIAIVQQFRRPPAERTWQGKVGVVPYDFRKPTMDRFRDTYWNPEGPIISAKAWGVGWAPNFGAVKGMLGR